METPQLVRMIVNAAKVMFAAHKQIIPFVTLRKFVMEFPTGVHLISSNLPLKCAVLLQATVMYPNIVQELHPIAL